MRSRAMIRLLTVPLLLCALVITFAQTRSQTSLESSVPPNYWPLEKSQPIIDKTQTIHLAPDLSQLSVGEKKAVAKLLEVGKIFQGIYEDQRHKQALSSYRSLDTLVRSYISPAPAETANLLTLYRLFQGPIATTLENKREPFLPVDPIVPGKNMYPWGVKKEEVETFLAAHPEWRDELLGPRSVVRRLTLPNLNRDLNVLTKYPALDTLHPGLKRHLRAQLLNLGRSGGALSDAPYVVAGADQLIRASRPLNEGGFYDAPYSIAYADQLIKSHGLLNEAADALQKDDEEFARYLRNRARDL